MKPAVRVENLSKQYRIGASRAGYRTLRESVMEAASPSAWLRRLRGLAAGGGEPRNTFWALRGVSFQVEPGEVVGIIGRNGAGKSTLLKTLSRIVEPTDGRVEIRGRVGSLLEVGTGFHHELTGRENIFLNGAILGMTRREILRKFDEIVAFAEVERFIDTPVKHYSSGMYVRLAFAVAAHLEPEVLIVDEVLAVGDANFQKRCLGKMREVSSSGRTVLFVSHNMAAVAELTGKAILLDEGRVVGAGEPAAMIDRYLKLQTSQSGERVWEGDRLPGDGRARLRAVRVRNAAGKSAAAVSIEEPLAVEVDYEILGAAQQINVAVRAFHEGHAYAFHAANLIDAAPADGLAPGHYRSACLIPGNMFNEGVYRIDVLLLRDKKQFVREEVLTLTVQETGHARAGFVGIWPGALRPVFPWRTEEMTAAAGGAD
ncbi:MAG TPA: ABC transporter ATP-binding protein [Gemmataceae bacterium]|nr:ABC transporter ATP-binding protein [Gemmataceae bacterium]